MTVVKINAITVAADRGDELGRRFAARGVIASQSAMPARGLLGTDLPDRSV